MKSIKIIFHLPVLYWKISIMIITFRHLKLFGVLMELVDVRVFWDIIIFTLKVYEGEVVVSNNLVCGYTDLLGKLELKIKQLFYFLVQFEATAADLVFCIKRGSIQVFWLYPLQPFKFLRSVQQMPIELEDLAKSYLVF